MVFRTKYQLMLSAGIYISVSVCPSREVALGGGAGKAGVPSELRARFSRVYLPLSTLRGTSSKAVVAPVTGTHFGTRTFFQDGRWYRSGICGRKSPGCTSK